MKSLILNEIEIVLDESSSFEYTFVSGDKERRQRRLCHFQNELQIMNLTERVERVVDVPETPIVRHHIPIMLKSHSPR